LRFGEPGPTQSPGFRATSRIGQRRSPTTRRYWPEDAGSPPGGSVSSFQNVENAMIAMRMWFVGVAVVGMAAGAAAAGLLWMVLTRPVALAQILSGSL
jgi:hypothetical protein